MKRSTLAAIAAAAVLAVGGGAAYAITSSQEPAPVETTLSATDSPTPDATPTGDTTEPVAAESPAALTAEDEAYLKEVQRRTWRVTVLDKFSDAELIAMGHEGCKQIRDGVKLEDLRLVDGETPTDEGYWLDTSAVFNSGLLSYCPDLIEDAG